MKIATFLAIIFSFLFQANLSALAAIPHPENLSAQTLVKAPNSACNLVEILVEANTNPVSGEEALIDSIESLYLDFAPIAKVIIDKTKKIKKDIKLSYSYDLADINQLISVRERLRNLISMHENQSFLSQSSQNIKVAQECAANLKHTSTLSNLKLAQNFYSAKAIERYRFAVSDLKHMLAKIDKIDKASHGKLAASKRNKSLVHLSKSLNHSLAFYTHEMSSVIEDVHGVSNMYRAALTNEGAAHRIAKVKKAKNPLHAIATEIHMKMPVNF